MNKLMTIAAVGLLIAGVGMVTVNAAETTGTATVKTLKNGLKNGAKTERSMATKSESVPRRFPETGSLRPLIRRNAGTGCSADGDYFIRPNMLPYLRAFSDSTNDETFVSVLHGSVVGSMQSPSSVRSGRPTSSSSSRRCLAKQLSESEQRPNPWL